jgi:hypothetical protein
VPNKRTKIWIELLWFILSGWSAVILSVWAQKLRFWANFARQRVVWGVAATSWLVIFEGDLVLGLKKRFCGNISHFGVAATLFKSGNCERMGV